MSEKSQMRSFDALLYPAAAGNVGWALCDLALKKGVLDPAMWPSYLSLIVILWYLVTEWNELANRKPKYGRLYWLADGVLLLSIVLLAIATQQEKDAKYFLVAALVIAVLGHLSTCWMREGDKYLNVVTRAITNGVGVPILLFWDGEWIVLFALVAVVIAYVLMLEFDPQKRAAKLTPPLPE